MHLLIGHGGMQGPPYPTGLFRKVTMIDLLGDLLGLVVGYLQQEMSIGACTGTSTPGLYPKPVIEQLHKEVKMDVGMIKGDHPQAVVHIVGQDLNPINLPQSGQCNLQQLLLHVS